MSGSHLVRTGFARTDDGMQLYWRTLGEGPLFVCCNGVGVSTFFWKYVAEHFRKTHKVVLWDYRGHGRSTVPRDPPTADLSMARNAADLLTVLDAVSSPDDPPEPAVLLGHSMGCQVILEFHKRHPSRVKALLPMFGTFARPLDTFMDFPYTRFLFRVIRRIAAQGGRPGMRLMLPLYASPIAYSVSQRSGMVDRYYAARADLEAYTEHLVHMDLRVFLRMVEFMADHDLTQHLPTIACPTLVFGAEADLFTPLHRSKRMAELIPDAELTVLAEGSHAAIVEQPETINLRIARFLRERCGQQA